MGLERSAGREEYSKRGGEGAGKEEEGAGSLRRYRSL